MKSRIKQFKRAACLLISAVFIVAFMQASVLSAYAATPSRTVSAKATLGYTIKGLPLARAIQNFYIGSTYIYVTQRVDSTTYLSRLKINGKEANYVDRMTLKNCGHGETLDYYTYNGEGYFYIGCKADTSTDYDWSLQIARIQYQAGKTYNYTQLERFTYMNYASKSSSRLGTTYRVSCAVKGENTIFRIQTKEGTVVYSCYNTTKLNKLLDKDSSVQMNTSSSRKACLWSIKQQGSAIIRPNSSFQGIDFSSESRIYLAGGGDGDTPQIARMNRSSKYLKLVKISNVGKKEIEGVQCKDGKIYFAIVTDTSSNAKKNQQKIYYLDMSAFDT